jgi:hypothetical protein
MIRILHALAVQRSPADVFGYLVEPANFPAWQAGVVEVKSEGKTGLGATFTEVRTFLGQRAESTLEVTEYRPNERFSLRVVSGPWLFEILHDLASVGTGTRLEVILQGETKGRLRLAAPMLEHAVRTDLEGNLATLKSMLETGR